MKLILTVGIGFITQLVAIHGFNASPAEGYLAYFIGIVLAKQIISEVIADERSQNG